MSDFLNQFGKNNYQKGSSITDGLAEDRLEEEYKVYSPDEYDGELEFDEIVYFEESEESGEAEYITGVLDSPRTEDGKDEESFGEVSDYDYQDSDDDFKKALIAKINQLPEYDLDAEDDTVSEPSLSIEPTLGESVEGTSKSEPTLREATRATSEIKGATPIVPTDKDIQGFGIGGIVAKDTKLASQGSRRLRQSRDIRQESSRQESSRQESRGKITAPPHVVVKDTSHHKRQMVRYGIIGLGIIAAALIAWFVFNTMNRVEVPDFVGTPLDGARGWELTNRVTIDATMVFDLEYDEGIIISQEVPPESEIRRGGVLRVMVSLGPNPEELIPLPDFSTMNTAQVRAWRTEVRGLNVSINEEYSDTVEEGGFIRMEFVNTGVTADTYTRQDGLLIFMSRGEEVFPENIVVPNFVGRIRADVNEWAEENNIIVTFEEETSDTVATDLIISQSIEPRRRIARYSEMTITISLGPSIIVPDFSGVTEEEAMQFEGLQITAMHRYHENVPFGRLISQSIAAGENVIGETPEITLTFSIGRPFLEDLTGTSEGAIAERFHQFTSRGADITYTVVRVNSWHPRGQIVDVSRKGEHLGMSEHITIWVSLENMNPPEPTPPDPTPPGPPGGGEESQLP